jgi:hypothetical protein
MYYITSILGTMPAPPPVSPEQWVSQFVEECKEKDMVSDIFGDEDTYYNPDSLYESTVEEIAENLGMTFSAVQMILHRVRGKISRRLFILNYMDKMPEGELLEILRSGKYNKINCNDFF